ncbi:hypothetical protein [Vulcanisaeta sp. EB80]|jgi:hypothetical protein|uniref:hypothetical protein n=1 Tax=Vulcanisaeta sp. EB80 TaxID=1650660 RepID=UPI00192E6D17|nr:hypothetical protein [Vulcanisaeta sp. EB80]
MKVAARKPPKKGGGQKADEALLSDKLVSKLGVVLIDIGEGLWCFKDELGKIVRRSL